MEYNKLSDKVNKGYDEGYRDGYREGYNSAIRTIRRPEMLDKERYGDGYKEFNRQSSQSASLGRGSVERKMLTS